MIRNLTVVVCLLFAFAHAGWAVDSEVAEAAPATETDLAALFAAPSDPSLLESARSIQNFVRPMSQKAFADTRQAAVAAAIQSGDELVFSLVKRMDPGTLGAWPARGSGIEKADAWPRLLDALVKTGERLALDLQARPALRRLSAAHALSDEEIRACKPRDEPALGIKRSRPFFRALAELAPADEELESLAAEAERRDDLLRVREVARRQARTVRRILAADDPPQRQPAGEPVPPVVPESELPSLVRLARASPDMAQEPETRVRNGVATIRKAVAGLPAAAVLENPLFQTVLNRLVDYVTSVPSKSTRRWFARNELNLQAVSELLDELSQKVEGSSYLRELKQRVGEALRLAKRTHRPTR